MIPNVGDEAPDFSVADSSGGERSLGSLVANGPCVLIFYRGHW
jgi:peroxiredoxin